MYGCGPGSRCEYRFTAVIPTGYIVVPKDDLRGRMSHVRMYINIYACMMQYLR